MYLLAPVSQALQPSLAQLDPLLNLWCCHSLMNGSSGNKLPDYRLAVADLIMELETERQEGGREVKHGGKTEGKEGDYNYEKEGDRTEERKMRGGDHSVK